MVFTAPAVHYSALATLPPELTTSKSQQSFKRTPSIQFKLSQIFKRLLNNDMLPKPAVHSPTITEKRNDIDPSTIIKKPNNNNSGGNVTTSTGQESPKSIPSLIEPLERLPFTEPYFAISPKKEKFSFELSAYHKHCIHQQKYVGQKQYAHQSLTKNSQPQLSTIKEHRSNLPNYRLKNSVFKTPQIDQPNEIKSNSTTTFPVSSSSIENHIGLRYASQKSTTGLHSSYGQQQTQRLRRLHSKSKIRPIPSETTTSKKSAPASSIAHRIELLKNAMHNNQLELHQWKSEKPSSVIDPIHRQTQTNNNQSKASEIHHIHHHHIHSSSYLSIQWRTCLSIIGTLSILFLFLIELTTIIF